MAIVKPRRPPPLKAGLNRPEKLAAIATMARKESDQRLAGYREQSLRLHPLVCARCGRAFDRSNLTELTVHHRDHNHDHNPADGSNWENLCIYCHDNEHSRYLDHLAANGASVEAPEPSGSTHSPFADLAAKLEQANRNRGG